MSKKFLALVGSPRPNSTSSHLAQYLVDGLAARNWQAETLVACEAIRNPEKWPALETSFREADVVAIVTPLYVDCVPAELTAAMERLAGVRGDCPDFCRAPARQGGKNGAVPLAARASRKGTLFAVVNCGFAEASQNDVALEIYRLFARDTGFHWAGGLAIGEGGMLGGKPLSAQGGKARHVIEAFDQTIAAVNAGEDVPVSASIGIRKNGMPTWAYFVMANVSMLLGAAKRGNLFKIGARPYAQR